MVEGLRTALKTLCSALPVAGLIALTLGVAAGPAGAQADATSKEYTPVVGQEGRDVIWVPTREQTVERMLDFANVTPKDVLVDLGSGDGRIVIAAARRGATARGIEFNPDMVELSNRNATKAGVSDKARFLRANIFEHDFSDANVLTMYLLPGLNIKLRPQVLDLRPGTRIVSHAFTMGDWEADRTESVEGSAQTIYLWIVPAKVAGSWSVTPKGGAPMQVTFTQQYQRLEGTVRAGARNSKISNGRLRGDQISFTLVEDSGGKLEYTGRVAGGRIEGSDGWTAVRAGK
ncbi:MAG: methyltransferase domain-containing protein [Proteobacteria bacterium]|nr:methyltransferase domain-containing protein [Burkholderiales bacterium]